ncbi:MAG: DUF4835 family protein [Paramuribaculum sp.]|nr:DUF4835 family protein [Paramuribaculum sp.]
MNLWKTLILSFLFSAGITDISARELNCKVEINYDKVTGANQDVFKQLEASISDYLNNTSFTDITFQGNELIDCSFFLTVDNYSGNNLTGSLQVTSTRPVYESVYTTPLLNVKDNDISFEYYQGQPLVYSATSIDSKLTGLLDFYAYLIIGMDFDSFEQGGGTDYLNEALRIMRLSRSGTDKGWNAMDNNRNRGSIITALTESPGSNLRKVIYDYHRNGLDVMSVSPEKGRGAITKSLESLNEIGTAAPFSASLSLFRDAKINELEGIYSQSSQDERKKVTEILERLYPTDIDVIEKIKKSSTR